MRGINSNGSIGFKHDVSDAIDLNGVYDFDIDSNGSYSMLVDVVSTGAYAIVRTLWTGTLDNTLSSDGVFDLQTQILALAGNASNCNSELVPFDMVVDPIDNSLYILGTVNILQIPSRATCATLAEHNKLRIWKVGAAGSLDATFGADALKSYKLSGGTVSGTSVLPASSNARFETLDGLSLTVVSKATVGSSEGIFHQTLDISGASPTVIANNGASFTYTQTNFSTIRDFYPQSTGSIAIVSDECDESCTSSTLFIHNPDTNSWSQSNPENSLFFYTLTIGPDDSVYVSAETRSNYADRILKYSSNGTKSSQFSGPQSSIGSRSTIDYWPGTLFVDNEYLTLVGPARNFINEDVNTFVYAARYNVNSITIPDPPAPAPAPVSVPAPVVATALPTQSAPVAVPAIVKAKKKISFPLNSSAGNPLIVRVSGSCSLSPVFKKVKVKVGKKTKKVKQQTGWTVQMKKKKQTCTITQTDAGGNGYAALSSTSTVTIK